MTKDPDLLFDLIHELSYLAEENGYPALSLGLESCLDLYLLENRKRETTAQTKTSPPSTSDSVAVRRTVLKLNPAMQSRLMQLQHRRAG